MNKQTDTDVIINGKKYTLSGYESDDYMQRVASYLNQKHAELEEKTDFRYLDKETQNVLMQLNIADDYFKLKSQMKTKENEGDTKNNEIFDLKHEIISLQTRLEACEKELEEEQQKFYEEEKKNIRLETELKDLRQQAEARVKEAVDKKKKTTKTMWLPDMGGGGWKPQTGKPSGNGQKS